MNTKEVDEAEVMNKPSAYDVELADLDFPVADLSSPEVRKQLSELAQPFLAEHGKLGLVITVERAQPPTPGHLLQILACLEIAENVAVILGSANADINDPEPGNLIAEQRDRDNPFPPEDRKFLLEHFLRKIGEDRKEDLLSRVSFVPVDDLWQVEGKKGTSDEQWKESVLEKVAALKKGSVAGIAANDGWVKDIFAKDMPAFSIPFYEKTPGVRYRGSDERDRLRQPRKRKSPVLHPRGRHRVIQAHV